MAICGDGIIKILRMDGKNTNDIYSQTFSQHRLIILDKFHYESINFTKKLSGSNDMKTRNLLWHIIIPQKPQLI